jgi:hypothetical protein
LGEIPLTSRIHIRPAGTTTIQSQLDGAMRATIGSPVVRRKPQKVSRNPPPESINAVGDKNGGQKRDSSNIGEMNRRSHALSLLNQICPVLSSPFSPRSRPAGIRRVPASETGSEVEPACPAQPFRKASPRGPNVADERTVLRSSVTLPAALSFLIPCRRRASGG